MVCAICLGAVYGLIGIVWWILGNGPANAEGILVLGVLTLIVATLFGIGNGIINYFDGSDKTASGNRSYSKASSNTCIIAFVWAKEGVDSNDLLTLGQLLKCWMVQQPAGTTIIGLDALLQGRYPATESRKFIEVDDLGEPVDVYGEAGPAIVYSEDGLSSREAIASLRKCIPETIASVGYSMKY
jgi:hypothetical protein